MGSLWSHLISQGTDTHHLLSIFWLDCRENNLVFQEEQCWLFKGPSSRKPSDSTCKKTFGMECVLQRRKWGKILYIMSLSTWKCVSDCIINCLTSIVYYKPVQITQSIISACICMQLQRLLSEKILLHLWSLLTAFFSLSLHPKQVARKKK